MARFTKYYFHQTPDMHAASGRSDYSTARLHGYVRCYRPTKDDSPNWEASRCTSLHLLSKMVTRMDPRMGPPTSIIFFSLRSQNHHAKVHIQYSRHLSSGISYICSNAPVHVCNNTPHSFPSGSYHSKHFVTLKCAHNHKHSSHPSELLLVALGD